MALFSRLRDVPAGTPGLTPARSRPAARTKRHIRRVAGLPAVTNGSSHLNLAAVTIRPSHRSRIPSRADRHHPATIRPRNSRLSAPPRRAEIAVHMEAPSALAAALASSAAQPRPPGGRPHPARLGRLDGYAKPYAGPYAKPYAGLYACCPRTPSPSERGITAGRAPSGGQSPAKTAGDWPPLGERCERA